MNLFSNLFSSSKQKTPTAYDEGIEHLKIIFQEAGEIYADLPLFHHQQQHILPCMMIHPDAGVVLFNFFNHSAKELAGVTASVANNKDEDAEIKSSDTKSFIQRRFDEIFHTQISPVRSILICPNLSEAEFDALDPSFHTLIPKSLALFSDSRDEHYLKCVIQKNTQGYDTAKIKQAIFGEFVLPDKNILFSLEQQKAVHLPFEKECLIKALPGSGKSSVLVAKALYEKMKDPSLKLIILGKLACNIHHLQAMIFQFLENSHWGINPADIPVISFESLQRYARAKERYDLVVCDDINEEDLRTARKLLNKKGRLLFSSSYEIDGVAEYPLAQNYRLSPALCAACEGLEVERLSENLSLQSGNTFMNTLLILEKLFKEAEPKEISIVHHNKDDLLMLQQEVNTFFTPICSLFDTGHEEGELLLYPLSHLSCINNRYIIVIVDASASYDTIELISRADIKTFILSQDENIHHLIQGETRETL